MERWSNDGAVCPHCEHLNDPSKDNYELYSEQTDGWTCVSCGNDFAVLVYTSHSWTTSPIEGDLT